MCASHTRPPYVYLLMGPAGLKPKAQARLPVERAATTTSVIDVLDRVLDKGVVIDASIRVSLAGIDLIGIEARVIVASIETYLKSSEAIRGVRAG